MFPVSQDVDFLGYRHFNNYILLRKTISKRLKRRIKRAIYKLKNGTINFDSFRSIVGSYNWLIQKCNCYNLSTSIGLDKIVKILKYSDTK